ncbi:MAG TPA: altronate dehydratase family protein [Candidatus Dormibacteraeota bacterium]|jgi:altronate hydrolase|nr:altronate dehydratase family protein [Candidatus Dormibacteraeota bacterium]
MTASRVLQLNPKDNVLVALADLRAGEEIEFGGRNYTLKTDVPAKHKFVTEDIAGGGTVIMYGVLIGKAMEPIGAGERLTTRNTHHEAAAFHEKTQEYFWQPPDISNWGEKTFRGYFRNDGQVGTRNYWLVVPLVFCENRNILVMKQAFEEELGFAPPQVYQQQVAELVRGFQEGKAPGSEDGRAKEADAPKRPRIFENVDGIKFLLHEGGCGGTREDAINLCGLIAGYIHHPNVAGATVLSLGCQHSQTAILREELKKRAPGFSKPLYVFEQQQSGSEFTMLSEAIRKTFAGLVEVNKLTRESAPLSKLCVGLKCGGSDGFSGISANPAIGHTSDLLVALGGRTILSEFPELCGVEQELINRSVQKEVADRFIQLMRDYAARAKAVRSGFDMNPSPGNIRDGLITDAMKSAGAAKKGGTAPVSAVLDYPEYSTQPGLHLQCTPGNDVECVTAQVGAGANVVLFTTGLGTPTGNPIAPVVKLSTNSALNQKMPDIIDIDTGEVIAGRRTISQMGEEILDRVIQIASGEVKTKAELLSQNDFIPWKRGVSL